MSSTRTWRRPAIGLLVALAILAACTPGPSTSPSEGGSPTTSAVALNPAFWTRVAPDAIQQPPGFMEVHHNSSGQLQNTCAPCHPAVDTTMTGVTSGPAGYVAVGWIFQGFHGVAWHSADGGSWTLDAALPERTLLASIAADSSRYVAVGLNGTSATAWTSTDGVEWQVVPGRDAFDADPLRLTSIVHWARGFAAAGYAGTEFGAAQAAFWWSADGLAWHRAPTSPEFANARVFAMTAGGPGLVAVGTAGPADAPGPAAVWVSDDGRSWHRVPDGPMFQGARMRAVTSAPGIGLVAAGEDLAGDTGAVWLSRDGLTWVRASGSTALGRPGIQVRVYGAASGGPGVLLVGTADEGMQYGEAVVWSSPDGLMWTRDAAGAEFADAELNAAWSDGSQLVAVGDRGAPDTYVATVWTGPSVWQH